MRSYLHSICQWGEQKVRFLSVPGLGIAMEDRQPFVLVSALHSSINGFSPFSRSYRQQSQSSLSKSGQLLPSPFIPVKHTSSFCPEAIAINNVLAPSFLRLSVSEPEGLIKGTPAADSRTALPDQRQLIINSIQMVCGWAWWWCIYLGNFQVLFMIHSALTSLARKRRSHKT